MIPTNRKLKNWDKTPWQKAFLPLYSDENGILGEEKEEYLWKVFREPAGGGSRRQNTWENHLGAFRWNESRRERVTAVKPSAHFDAPEWPDSGNKSGTAKVSAFVS